MVESRAQPSFAPPRRPCAVRAFATRSALHCAYFAWALVQNWHGSDSPPPRKKFLKLGNDSPSTQVGANAIDAIPSLPVSGASPDLIRCSEDSGLPAAKHAQGALRRISSDRIGLQSLIRAARELALRTEKTAQSLPDLPWTMLVTCLPEKEPADNVLTGTCAFRRAGPDMASTASDILGIFTAGCLANVLASILKSVTSPTEPATLSFQKKAYFGIP
eukprot:3861195-Rhodomonas_salina.1